MSYLRRNNHQAHKLLLISAILLLVGISCQQAQEQIQQPAAVVENPVTPTVWVELPTAGVEPAVATPISMLPTPIMFETATPMAEQSLDSGKECVQGYWTVKPASLQTYANLTIQGSKLVDLTPSAVTGSNSILITYDQIYIVVDNLKVDLSANNSTINIVINGTVSAHYSINKTRFKVNTIVYDLSGTLIEPAQTSTLDLNGLFNLARYLGFGLDYSKPPITENVRYTCQGDQLLLDMNDHANLTLTRAEP
jgi:hypothetical protein